MAGMAEGELPLSTDASPPSSTNVPTPGPVTEGAAVGAGVLAPDIPESVADGLRDKFTDKVKKLVRRIKHGNEPKPKKKPEVPPVDECPKHGDDQPDDRYDFNHSKRGVAVLIVNTEFRNAKENRPSAEKDISNLTSLFEVLGFQIKVLKNKTTQQLTDSLIDIRSQLEKDSDCFACLISTHGGEFPVQGSKNLRQHVLSTFDSSIPTDDIISTFNDNECTAMKGKPKLFFIQACRGRMGVDDAEVVDSGLKVYIITDNSEQPYANKEEQRRNGEEQKRREQTGFCSIPCYSHCLVMFSSAPERLAWSDYHTGGWLPYCMYNLVHRFQSFQTDLLQVLTEVNNEIATNMKTRFPNKPEWHQSKSVACIYHKLTKKIYFQLK